MEMDGTEMFLQLVRQHLPLIWVRLHSGSGNAAAVYGCTDSTACNFNADAMQMMLHVHMQILVQTVMVTV